MDAGHVGRGRGSRRRELGAAARAGRNRPAVAVEGLEPRELLTGAVSDILTLTQPSALGPIAVGASGNLWFADKDGSGRPALGQVGTSGSRGETTLTNDDRTLTVAGIAADPQGDIWYSLAAPPEAARPTAPAATMAPEVGYVVPGVTIKHIPLPSSQDSPGAMTLGPDGNVWVAVSNPSGGASLARVTHDGTVTEFPVRGAQQLTWLTTGRDGDLWFVDGAKVGKMTTSGAVTEFDLPAPADGSPVDLSNAQLTAAGDGNVWFIGLGGLSRITPAGDVKTFNTQGTQVTSLSAGNDGNLWFSFLPTAGSSLAGTPGAVVGRMTPQGLTTLLPDRVDATGNPVVRMAPGQDASIWMNEGDVTFARLGLTGILPINPTILNQTAAVAVTTDPKGAFTGAVASFTPTYAGASASDFSAVIDWGDGHQSAGHVTVNSQGGYDVVGSNMYAAPAGSQEHAKVTITGPNGVTAPLFNTVTVAAAPATPPAATPPAKTGTATGTANPWRPYPAGHLKPTTPAGASTGPGPVTAPAQPAAVGSNAGTVTVKTPAVRGHVVQTRAHVPAKPLPPHPRGPVVRPHKPAPRKRY